LSKSTRLTDNGRTDTILIARARLHSMQRGNKAYHVIIVVTDLFYFHVQLNWSSWSRSRIFGLSLITAFWSRSQSQSCTLWSRSWLWSW